MSFMCNKNTVRITLCIIYTGNKAKANLDKFYSLLLFCSWIKKNPRTNYFLILLNLLEGYFISVSKRREKKSIFQYFQFYSCIKIVAVFYFWRNSFFTKISEHLLIESEQWFQECISSWLSSISLIDQNKTWRHHMVLTLSIIDSKQSCHSNDVILIFLAAIRTVTIKLLIWHLVFFGVDHTKLEVDRTLSKAHKQHVIYIYNRS